MTEVLVRPYKTADFNAVLRLFDANCPAYFAPAERTDFVHYLQNELDHYFVVEHANQLIGAGGINFFPEKACAYISWDFVLPDFQGKGVGRKVMAHRLAVIRRRTDIQTVVVRTSQFTDPFYTKCGFTEVKREKNYWSAGFDLVEMTLFF